MKKTLVTLALMAGMVASSQAAQTQTWTSQIPVWTAGEASVVMMPEGATYPNCSLTAVLNVPAVTKVMVDNSWNDSTPFLYVTAANPDPAEGDFYQAGLSIGGTIIADDEGSVYDQLGTIRTWEYAVFGPAGFPFETEDTEYASDAFCTYLENTLRDGSTYEMAVTVKWDDVGCSAYVTLVDEEGKSINKMGTASPVLFYPSEWILESIIYDTEMVESISFYDTALSDEAAYAANVAAIKSSNVPEPTTATLSLLALAGLAARRRRK